jgi:eukaryotic-like serine/threonine-protein kinase
MNTGEILDGKYEITARLGAGGMGEIYKATHTLLGASRVIKVVHPQIATNTDARDRFLREARVATKIQHPNVATLYDFAALPDGSHYMVWEFIDGENLAQRLRTGGTLPPRQAVHVAVQVLHGLEAIHRAGIIHRDISPENIMITPDNTVKIIDLGVAKLDDDGTVSQTRTGIFVGKLRYAAPEQLGFLPEGEKIDGRADLYALAMVVVELLTGRPPYEAKSPHEYFLHHAREIPMNTVELPANLPGSDVLQQILQKALARNREERFASAHDFAMALEGIEGTMPDTTSGTVAMPLDSDATWRPSDAARETALGSGRTPAAGVVPAPAPAAVTAVVPQAAETVRTPLPSVGSYGPRKRNPAIAIVAVLALLVAVGGAFAYALWPKITQAISPITKAISPSTTTSQPAVTQSQPAVTATTAPSQTAMTVTPPSTDTSKSVVTASAANPPISIVNSRPPVKTASNHSVTPPVRTDRPAEVLERPSEPRHDEPAHDRGVREERSGDEEEGRSVPARVPSIYVDGPGRHMGNDRALARLRHELRGVREVILLGGGQQVMVYRALHRAIPSLQFGSDSNVTIQWDATPVRLGRERGNLTASATISKDGRVIFRYDLPAGVDASSAADAFAQTIAEAFSD